MVKLVLFDIDGTLISTNGAGVRAFEKVFASEFGAADATRGVRFAGRTDFALVREIFGRLGVPATRENFARFFDRYVFWLGHLLEDGQGGPCPGVTGFLRELRHLPRPPTLGLLTGNLRLGAEIKLRRYGLWEEFTLGGFADDHEDRDQIAVAARARGRQHLGPDLADDEIVVVGDTRHDVRCGRAIGARVLAVATGGESFEELHPSRPDWLVRDLRDISADNQTFWAAFGRDSA